MDNMPHDKIDAIRRELMLAKTRKTTFTSIEIIVLSYLLYWDFMFVATGNFDAIDCYTVLGEILTKPMMIIFLSSTIFIMLIAGLTKRKGLRYMGLMMSTFLWLLVASSIMVESLNMRSSTIILAVASAYQYIQIAMGRDT